MRNKLLTILGLIGFGLLGRLLPHIPNSTPMSAVALRAGRDLGRIWAVVIPLSAMLIVDAVIGFYDWRILTSVYVSFALIGMVGYSMRFVRVWGMGGVVCGSSFGFFLITNFAVWLFSPWYAKTLAGLLYCYGLGFPFFLSMLAGDILYTALLFGAFDYVRARTHVRAACARG
ncbi:MAG: hypothetical protein QG621_380 [Patescibacteria group bacterium]|nr:hypothetical protein [Patescibacteria group bacterium]